MSRPPMDLLGILIFALVVIPHSYTPDQAVKLRWSKVHHHQIKPRAYTVIIISPPPDKVMVQRWYTTRQRYMGQQFNADYTSFDGSFIRFLFAFNSMLHRHFHIDVFVKRGEVSFIWMKLSPPLATLYESYN